MKNFFNKIIAIARKLGIWRFGSVSGTYTNAKDRPTGLMMDDVYDDKKDLVTKDDVKKVKNVFTGKK